MAFENINNENYVLYASRCYDAPICIQAEFQEDLKHIKYIKRLFRKYKADKDLKERLILNHIICLYNVFGPECSTRLLFLKIDERDYDLLKTCLVFLHYLPDMVIGVNGKDIPTDIIPINKELANDLRTI